MKLMLPGLLLMLCAGLAVAIGAVFAAPLPPLDTATIATPAHPPAVREAAVYVPPPPQAYDIINTRAAFNPDRTAVIEPAPAANGTALVAPDLTLTGVVIGPAKSLALLDRKGADAAVSVGLGAVLDGWTLSRVEPDRVFFRAGSAEVEIPLRSAAGVVQRPASAPPPPSAATSSMPGRAPAASPPQIPSGTTGHPPDYMPPQSRMKIIGLPATLPAPPKFLGTREPQTPSPE